MKVGIVDTDIANIGSVVRALRELGAEPVVAREPSGLKGCARVILPGVGSFSAGMAQLNSAGFTPALRDMAADGLPLLGICLGMQLLAERGNEGGECAGLGLVPGEVVHLRDRGCPQRLPHMGWNSVNFAPGSRLAVGLPPAADFYFVHSYVFLPGNEADVTGVCDYGVPFAAMVQRGSVYGAQFHPEKSSAAGFAVIRNFLAV